MPAAGLAAGAFALFGLTLVAQLAGGGLALAFGVVRSRPVVAVAAKMPRVAAIPLAVSHDGPPL